MLRHYIPHHVAMIMQNLTCQGHQAFLVGGACRDLLMDKTPKDWDISTSAHPDEIKKCLPEFKTLDIGEAFGVITVLTPNGAVEVTTFRREGYGNSRKPDHVTFLMDIKEDLSRRDFTANAIAWKWPGGPIEDPFGGRRDIQRRRVRAVGDPEERLAEDPLRMLRALRFVAEDWRLESSTRNAIRKNSSFLTKISQERIRQELLLILGACRSARALWEMSELGIMKVILPELEEGRKIKGVRGPFDNVLEHSIATVHYLRPDPGLRLAGLLHDVAKPRTHVVQDGKSHFHEHADVGEAMAKEILKRLRFDNDTVQRVCALVREHMSYLGPNVTDAGLRRLTGRVGKENIMDLLDLKAADMLASGGVPGEWFQETRMRIQDIVEGREAIETRDLAVSGHDVMEILGIPEGPEIGRVLHALLEVVLEEPAKNDREYLTGVLRTMSQRRGN